MAKKRSDLFDAINSINYKTKKDFDIKKVNPFILSLWLAQDKNLIKYVQKLNPYIFHINNEIAFCYYYKKIPKGKRFIRWTKKKKTENSKEVQELMDKFNISEKEAKLSL